MSTNVCAHNTTGVCYGYSSSPTSSITGGLVLRVAIYGPAVDCDEVGPSGRFIDLQGTPSENTEILVSGACLAFVNEYTLHK